LEFEFKRDVLVQLGLDGLSSVMAHRAGLWSYATTEWLKLCIPSQTDATRSRWPVHPLWAALASVDWNADGGPLLRTFKPLRAPSPEWLGMRALSTIASVAAVTGEVDFDAAARKAADLASFALTRLNRGGESGISFEQFFTEKVEGLVRQYNVRMNVPPVDAPDPDDYITRNPYWRAKQGKQDQ
jgi:hypothetical protein